MAQAFSGAKLAILTQGRVLVLLRDDIDGIAYPGMWDLPGGRAEEREDPEGCALRELREETGLALDRRWLVWRRSFGNPRRQAGKPVWMLVAEVPDGVLGAPVLGDEGQALEWMAVGDFLRHPEGIAHLQAQLGTYLRERAAREGSAHM